MHGACPAALGGMREEREAVGTARALRPQGESIKRSTRKQKETKEKKKKKMGDIFQLKHCDEKQKWETDEGLSTPFSTRLHLLLRAGGCCNQEQRELLGEEGGQGWSRHGAPDNGGT